MVKTILAHLTGIDKVREDCSSPLRLCFPVLRRRVCAPNRLKQQTRAAPCELGSHLIRARKGPDGFLKERW
jgi:hypothetical protein